MPSNPEWGELRRHACGDRADYTLEPRPLSTNGGQGEVFRAVHKPTGITVAFKRVRNVRNRDAVARMAREIEVARTLATHSRVMPVLDASADHTWIVMPLASKTAEDSQAGLAADSQKLLKMVRAVATGVGAAHRIGWIHRDLKPANILLLDRRWVVADWGLGRRPRGATSTPGRTRVGTSYGTEGFAAPELSVDAHDAGAPADIYSLGQVIGWALTGNQPQANVPLLPRGGPWRAVVRASTRLTPGDRPQDAETFLELVESQLAEPDVSAASIGDALLVEIGAGRGGAIVDLAKLAARDPGDYELYIDVIPQLSRSHAENFISACPDPVEVVRSFLDHLGGDWDHRDFKWADRVIMLIFWIAAFAERTRDWTLLEEAADALFAWDDHWNQFKPQDAIGPWLRRLDGEGARIVASAIRNYSESLQHFSGVADRRSDPRIISLLGRT